MRQSGTATEDDPFLERPDEHEPGSELYCWMPGNDHRECDGSCIAFEEKSVKDQRVGACQALNAIRSLALTMGLKEKRARSAAVKEVIDNLPEPPEVTS
jgi:hypothetical protein